MKNKGEFYQEMSEEQKKAGWIKFNIPAPEEGMTSLDGEGVWGWVSPEDKARWADDTFEGKIKSILLNDPLRFGGQLTWGTEVVIQCHGPHRPTLDAEWAKENLVFPEPGDTKTYRIVFNGGDRMVIDAPSQYDAVRGVMLIVGQPFCLDYCEVVE